MNNEPIFKSIFGDDWNRLPPALNKHYANRPYTNDMTQVDGILDLMCSGPIKIFAWLFWLMRGIPPHSEKNVPVTVYFESDTDSKSFHFNRVFYFKSRKTYRFESRMIQTKENEVIEVMRSGLGWRMNYVWENERVKLLHKGYVLCVFGRFIPLPISYLLGEGYAEEVAIDENSFEMFVTITHPWWDKIYEYKGRFAVKDAL